MTDATVDACPECDQAGHFYSYSNGGVRCEDCGATFDEPVQRPPRTRPDEGYTDDGLPANCAVKDQLRELRGD
jgi:ribosomal protein L37AE/L43A